jgi:hypothetical protein
VARVSGSGSSATGQSRCRAATSASGELSPEALAAVVWPSPKLAITSARAVDDDRRHEYPDETKACALALIDAGASWSEAAREVGVGKSTVAGLGSAAPSRATFGPISGPNGRGTSYGEKRRSAVVGPAKWCGVALLRGFDLEPRGGASPLIRIAAFAAFGFTAWGRQRGSSLRASRCGRSLLSLLPPRNEPPRVHR